MSRIGLETSQCIHEVFLLLHQYRAPTGLCEKIIIEIYREQKNKEQKQENTKLHFSRHFSIDLHIEKHT